MPGTVTTGNVLTITFESPEVLADAPAPTGTVVLAVGEQLMAVEAENYVKARLERAGVEVVRRE